MIAIKNGQIKIVSFLLKAGANTDTTSKRGRTAFKLAIDGGYIKNAQLLLETGVSVDRNSLLQFLRLMGYRNGLNKLVENFRLQILSRTSKSIFVIQELMRAKVPTCRRIFTK